MRGTSFAVVLGVSWLVTTANALAGPILAIDLDPSTPDIQDMLAVSVGSPFDVDVVLVGDGVSLFDAVTLDVASTLNFVGGPVAGGLASTAMFAVDAFLPIPGLSPGDPLSIPGLPLAPGGFGGAGMLALGGPFALVGMDDIVTVFQLTLVAPTPGDYALSIADIDPLGDFLALAGFGVPVSLQGASITAMAAAPVSEPASLLLIATALTCVVVKRRRSTH